jgi:ketosteroid isomerase-like protein
MLCFFVVCGATTISGCNQTEHSSSRTETASTLPPDLQKTVDTLIGAIEAFDVSAILSAYTDDFISGTGRSKQDVGNIFTQLRSNQVSLHVQDIEVGEVEATQAQISMTIRVRYSGRFRNVGEGPVVLTDVLRHSLRKETSGWKIYTDLRLASYQEGRYGDRSPNVHIELPKKLPSEMNYPATITVQREKNTVYQIMLGNYPEDPGFLPPPDVVTELPPDGVLKVTLLTNPQGSSEMVRLTVMALTSDGEPLGATLISTFVPGKPRHQPPSSQASV